MKKITQILESWEINELKEKVLNVDNFIKFEKEYKMNEYKVELTIKFTKS